MKNVTEPNGSNVTSISKVLANRENAKKSTGPKSLFGKSRVSETRLNMVCIQANMLFQLNLYRSMKSTEIQCLNL